MSVPIDVAVEMLRAGGVGAIYGRMEFGPRALDARSILASPNDPLITDKLNKRLSRSEFMPVAPYVLAEDPERVFEVTPRNPVRCAIYDDRVRCAAGMAQSLERHPTHRRFGATADYSRGG
jgi:predicted NodU family carbamoyl transferase